MKNQIIALVILYSKKKQGNLILKQLKITKNKLERLLLKN